MGHSFGPFVFGGIAIIVLVFAAWSIVRQKRRFHSARGHALLFNLPQNSQAIGPLLELLFCPDLEVSGKAATRLVSLIPGVIRGDDVWLSPGQKECLAKGLDFPDTTLVCNLIELICFMGDPTWLDKVTELSRLHGNPRIVESAKACVSVLKRKREEKGETLLRPAAGAAMQTGLLRPAGLCEMEEQSLLRAAETTEPGN